MRYLSFSVILISLACLACGKIGKGSDDPKANTAQENKAVQVNPFPWNFPQDIDLDAEPGQTVLSCYNFYSIALKNGNKLDEQTLIFYNTTLRELGDTVSMVENKAIIPNALIIPLPKQILKPHKGDILLTWWQSGSGMQRAIVVSDSIASEPIVNYLDMDYTDTNGKQGLGQSVSDEQLHKGTYAIIAPDEWQSGAQIAAKTADGKWMATILLHEKSNKVLAIDSDNKVRAFSKADCRLVPLSTQWNEGESVWAAINGIYQPGYTITHTDNAKGRVTVSKDGQKHILSIARIAKNFNGQPSSASTDKKEATSESAKQQNSDNSPKQGKKQEDQKKTSLKKDAQKKQAAKKKEDKKKKK